MTCCSKGCRNRVTHVVSDPDPDPSTQNLLLLTCSGCARSAELSGYSTRRAPKR